MHYYDMMYIQHASSTMRCKDATDTDITHLITKEQSLSVEGGVAYSYTKISIGAMKKQRSLESDFAYFESRVEKHLKVVL